MTQSNVVAGVPTVIGTPFPVTTTTFQYPRRAVLIGDSITARGNYAVTVTSLTVDASGLGTFTATSHALYPGAKFSLQSASIDQYNGLNTCVSRTSSSVFTAQLQKGLAGAATGATMASLAIERLSDRNWFELANAQTTHSYYPILNMGASGQTTTEILARFKRDVLQYQPDLVQIQGGVNDIIAAAAGNEATVLATLKSNFTSMIQQTLAIGAIPLVLTVMPLDSSASGYTAARGQLLLKFNQWLRQIAAYTYPKMVLFDAWAVCVDPTDATGDWKANYSTDGIHPTANACEAMGIKLATILPYVQYPSPTWVGSVFDTYDNDSSNPQIDPNPLNTGTGGTKATSGAGTGTNTGNVPDSYTCTWTRASTGANVNAVTARADGFGNDLVCTATSVDANDAVDIVQTSQLHARVSAGDVLVAEAEITVSSITNMSNLSFAFEWASDGVTYTQPAAIGSAASGQIVTGGTYLFRTPPLTVPAAGMTGLKTRLKMTFAGAGGAVLKYGRHSITKLQNAPSYVPPTPTVTT